MGHDSRTQMLDDLAVTRSGKFVVKTATCTLKVYEQYVRCENADATMTITMPPVAECAGKLFSLFYPADTTFDVTIAAPDAEGWDGDYTLDSAGDGRLLYSDGRHWWSIGDLT